MRKMMTVRVTKKDIKYGRRSDGSSCAIALALKDKGFKQVAVDQMEICVMKNGMLGEYDVPAKAARFIENFDADKKTVKPGTFKFKLRSKYDARTGEER